MSNVKMPEPVAWWNPRKDNASTDPVHRHNDSFKSLITTEQAEAYAQARVNEALDEAVKIAETMHPDTSPLWVGAAIHRLKKEQS